MRALLLSLVFVVLAAAAPGPKPPATFEPNVGQSPSQASALGRGADWSAGFFRRDVVVHYGDGARWRLRLPQSLHPKLGRRSAAAARYYSGPAANSAALSAPVHESVAYDDVAPGIDLVFHARRSAFEVDVHVRPEAALEDFRLDIDGLERARIQPDGSLWLGSIRQKRPQAWQDGPAGREPVDVAYRLDERGLGFDAGRYDRTRPLVIDPLVYSTYLGGGFGVSSPHIDVDATGAIYITGFASGVDFPLTPGGIANPQGPALFVTKLNPSKAGIDALEYSNFLVADRDTSIERFEVTPNGRAYIIGTTRAEDFPVTPNAFQTRFSNHVIFPAADVFVTVLDLGTGIGQLVYSSYLGGDRNERVHDIRLRSDGRLDLFGQTDSSDFPLTPGAYDSSPGKAFMTTLNIEASGVASVEYSTYLALQPSTYRTVPVRLATAWDSRGWLHVSGRIADVDADRMVTATAYSPICVNISGGDCGDSYYGAFDLLGENPKGLVYGTYVPEFSYSSVAVDVQGRAYLASATRDIEFADTLGLTGGECIHGPGRCSDLSAIDVGVVGIDPALEGAASRFLSTRIGGDQGDTLWNSATDPQGRLHLVGQTNSLVFPSSPDAYEHTCPLLDEFRCDGTSLFVVTIDPAKTGPDALLYSGTFGRSNGVALAGFDGQGRVYITGAAYRDAFPTTSGALDAGVGEQPYESQFVAVVDPDGVGESALAYSTLLSGGDIQDARVLPNGRVYLAGNAVTPTLPVTTDAFDQTCGFGLDSSGGCPRVAFATVLDPIPGPALNANPSIVELSYRIPEQESPRQVLLVETDLPDLEYGIVAESREGWLSISADRMQGPGSIEVRADVGALGPGAYTGRITLTSSEPFVRRAVDVHLQVDGAAPGVIAAVTHAATFSSGPVSPGQIISVFGSGFGPRDGVSVSVQDGQLAESVGGTRLWANGVACPILFARHDQINAVSPFAFAGQTGAVRFEVSTVLGSSSPFSAPLGEANPGLFMAGATGSAAALNEDGSVNTPDNPAAAGSVVVLFGTGGGATEPPVTAWALAPATLARIASQTDVSVGGVQAETLFAGLAPGFSGLYQFNVRLPLGVVGEVEAQVAVGGVSSPAATIFVR